MNMFVLNALLPGVGLGAIYRGCWPFVFVLAVMLALLIAFPQLSLWLPSLMH
jgi:TRAP-type C4-dicarboxylate transport system permease large subunit